VLVLNKINNKTWFGLLSLLLFIIGVLFSVSFGNKPCYGDIILKFIGLKPWSKVSTGLHYTAFYSLIFFIPSFILGYKFKETLGLSNVSEMRRIDTWECKVSLLIVIISSFVLPGKIIQDGTLIEYAFGFPSNYWFIYQQNKGSFQLFSNLFNGNTGMSINILSLFINIVIIYYVLILVKKIYMKFNSIQ
jgi:hypothetical protein